MSVYPANQVNSIFKEHLEDERQYKTTSLSSKIASFVNPVIALKAKILDGLKIIILGLSSAWLNIHYLSNFQIVMSHMI